MNLTYSQEPTVLHNLKFEFEYGRQCHFYVCIIGLLQKCNLIS